ncbi:prepilin-type N-terminal cleavage/methylation domain-containing protein [Candidatus Falkowbacteria bacterium]|nr:prepilin-type N-terminal cleavage/methylation domain-containing protein [Candidatus Falkowbacteria bacterium]
MRDSFDNNQSGFTLVELLVTLSIFSVVLLLISGAFIFSERSLTGLASQEQVIGEARWLIESIARDIRLSALDYSDPAWPVSTLTTEIRLVSSDGQRLHYGVGGNACPPTQAGCISRQTFDAEGVLLDSAVLSTSALSAADWHFFVTPMVDPFLDDNGDGQYDSTTQPQVTIFFALTDALKPEQAIQGQTTVSSRYYGR